MKKILVAGLHHESNTFNPIITDEKDFNIYRGDEILKALNKDDSISGIIDTLREAGHQVIPILMARAVPNGVVSRPLYEALKSEILDGMRRHPDADGITLSLHGSMRIEDLGEAEGDLLEAVRQIHPEIPLNASLDMHATVTARMMKYGDAFVGYKQAPHTDCYETGQHAARLTLEALATGRRLKTVWCRVPILIAGEQTETSTEPMRSMIAALRREEERADILAASFLLGFPWADCQENGVSVLVVTRGHSDKREELARSRAEALGQLFWHQRQKFQFYNETGEPGEILARALQAAEAPLYISDSGDNPTAGSSGDCTNFLGLILDSPEACRLDPPLLYAGLYDPPAVAVCRDAEGEELTLKVGAGYDSRTSRPLTLTGRVRGFVSGWGDFKTDMALFRTGGIDLILTAKHIGFVTPAMFEAFGIDVAERRLVVVKLGYLTAAHKAVAARSLMALTDGSSNENLKNLPYHELSRPIFPLDEDMETVIRAESGV